MWNNYYNRGINRCYFWEYKVENYEFWLGSDRKLYIWVFKDDMSCLVEKGRGFLGKGNYFFSGRGMNVVVRLIFKGLYFSLVFIVITWLFE